MAPRNKIQYGNKITKALAKKEGRMPAEVKAGQDWSQSGGERPPQRNAREWSQTWRKA